MLHTIAFGEALIDMLSNRVGHSTAATESFTKYAGGAPANVAAAIARLGGHSFMAGKIGDDMFGQFLREELHNAGVDTRYLLSTQEANTALAFVSLDKEGERSFTFYRHPSADMLFRSSDFQASWFTQPGIFHLCSNTLTAPDIADATSTGIGLASQAGWLISFDVNLRHNLWIEGEAQRQPVWAIIRQSHLVKMSVDEMAYLRQDTPESIAIQTILTGKTRLLILTDGSNPLRYFYTKKQQTTRPIIVQSGELIPPTVTMIDSTAAGDAFVGGLLYQLSDKDILPEQLPALCENTDAFQQLLMFAARCGGYTAAHYGAFAALPELKDVYQS